ncbi:MAG: hypothetical protein HY454_02630 [Parcubacteria group bacterium]|nr:hypothetical protein [Parcubacteria group bacterium]
MPKEEKVQPLLWRFINYSLEAGRLRQRREAGRIRGSQSFRLKDLEARLIPSLQSKLVNSD